MDEKYLAAIEETETDIALAWEARGFYSAGHHQKNDVDGQLRFHFLLAGKKEDTDCLKTSSNPNSISFFSSRHQHHSVFKSSPCTDVIQSCFGMASWG